MDIYIDGGTRGNRICLYDKSKDKIITKQRGGELTNNELEYLALLYSLEYIANNYRHDNITIYTDSLLVANQMNGRWRITTDHLIPLHDKCSKKMNEKIKIVSIRRFKNFAGIYLEKGKLN